MPFPYLDELDKVFGPDRASGAAFENFEEAVHGLQNETIELDKDEEEDEEEEGESVQSTRPTLKISKKTNKDPTPKGKGKRKASQCEVVDLTSSFNVVSSKLTGFMDNMNSHLSNIASALCTTQQHEQILMNREMKLDEQKVGLFNEVMCIPGISRDDAMEAVKKLARDSSLLPIFYQCPEEWKKNFIMKLIHPNASSSFMG